MHHRVRKSVISAMPLEHGSAPASRGPLSSSPFSSTIAANTTSPSFRRHSKSSINTKARPEHQHSFLVLVPLPRTSSTSHSRSSSLGSTSTTLGPFGAAKLAPSVSTIDASGTLVAQPPTSASGVLPSTIDGLLNSVPVHHLGMMRAPGRDHKLISTRTMDTRSALRLVLKLTFVALGGQGWA